MRILHVLESLAAGGMETTFLNVLRACRTLDPSIEHHVLAFSGGGLEARFREVASHLAIAFDDATIDRHLRHGHDVVHVLFERCAYRLIPRIMARTSTPIVYAKGYDMGGTYRLNEGLDWQADESMLAAADGVTFTTAALAEGYAIPPGRTTVLRKAADIAAFMALPLPTPETPMRIVCVANLHPLKRLGDLITAFRDVRREVPGAELRLVGGGNERERERLTQLAADLGLAGHVSFAGAVRDVAAEIAQARVVALASSTEGVSTALLEGMAAGRPVVATRVGHLETIIDEGVEGYFVEVGDVGAMADRLVRLLRDTTLAHVRGQAARRRASSHDVNDVARDALNALRAAAQSPVRSLAVACGESGS
ncbi:MAG TPA: glycosyltransferase [Vicinamibacterales bacterium]|nr:glycosyltransferase [Vicinamibacterales bacterium]